MHKRRFLASTTFGALALPAAAAPPGAAPRGPGLLTVTGAIGKGTRGAIDPALDQLMVKQKVRFDRAHVFDFAALAALPAASIKPTLEYDARPHALRGPLLADVLKATGATPADTARIILRALDGYSVGLSLADARRHGFIVATHLDDAPMALGGLGPLWAVFDADRHADIAARPLAERFALCPWGLYHAEIQAG
jgi:hypothetical protein